MQHSFDYKRYKANVDSETVFVPELTILLNMYIVLNNLSLLNHGTITTIATTTSHAFLSKPPWPNSFMNINATQSSVSPFCNFKRCPKTPY